VTISFYSGAFRPAQPASGTYSRIALQFYSIRHVIGQENFQSNKIAGQKCPESVHSSAYPPPCSHLNRDAGHRKTQIHAWIHLCYSPAHPAARWYVPGDWNSFFGVFFNGFPDWLLNADLAPPFSRAKSRIRGKLASIVSSL